MPEPSSAQDPDVPDTKGAPSAAKPPREILELATDVVAKLDVIRFLKQYETELYGKLKDAENYAKKLRSGNGDVAFMTASLPITNGIIHIASNRENILAALDELGEDWTGPHADTISALSALTLVYLVTEGWQAHKGKSDEDTWIDIMKRIRRWTESKD